MEIPSSNNVDIEELIFGISSLQLAALTHAAKLSPLVSACTLGPHSNSSNKENQKESTTNITFNKEEKSEISKENTRVGETQDIIRTDRKVLDFNVFNNNAILHSAEKQRKDEIKKDLCQRRELTKAAEDRRRMQIYEKSVQEEEKRIAGKVEIDNQIVEEVENFVKNASEESNKHFENLRREEGKKLKRITFDVISFYQKNFKMAYERIANLLPSIDKKMFPKMEEYNKLLKILIVNYENLKQKVRNDDIGPTEVKFAANLLTNIEMIYTKLRQEVEKFKKESKIIEEEQRLAERNEAAIIEANLIRERQHNAEQAERQITVPDGTTEIIERKNIPISQESTVLLASFVNSERMEFYNELMTFYYTKMENYNSLMSDDTIKKPRSAWQKAINIPINTISAVSPQHLQDKFDKIYYFITGKTPKTPEMSSSPLEHPMGRDFCLILLAKKLVSQGETTVSSNAQAAFPIAAIIVALWQNVPDFGKLFLACTFKECPYLVPCFIPQFKGQSMEEYFRILGYKMIDGILEKQDMYLKRQSGIARLYFAVMMTQPRQNFGPHPYGIEHGWKWLCSILNLEPLPDICATVILEFLQTAGPSIWNAYGKQFSKILVLMQNQYIVKLSQVDEGGPKARLEVFLLKVLKEGRIEEPSGILPANFW